MNEKGVVQHRIHTQTHTHTYLHIHIHHFAVLTQLEAVVPDVVTLSD